MRKSRRRTISREGGNGERLFRSKSCVAGKRRGGTHQFSCSHPDERSCPSTTFSPANDSGGCYLARISAERPQRAISARTVLDATATQCAYGRHARNLQRAITRDACELCVVAGMRVSELCSWTWSDVDLKRNGRISPAIRLACAYVARWDFANVRCSR